jgi:hypothetical protein
MSFGRGRFLRISSHGVAGTFADVAVALPIMYIAVQNWILFGRWCAMLRAMASLLRRSLSVKSVAGTVQIVLNLIHQLLIQRERLSGSDAELRIVEVEERPACLRVIDVDFGHSIRVPF